MEKNSKPIYVEGYKVVKRHNGATIAIAFLALAIAMLPLIYVFTNWLKIAAPGLAISLAQDPEGEYEFLTNGFNIEINGLDLIKFLFNVVTEGLGNVVHLGVEAAKEQAWYGIITNEGVWAIAIEFVLLLVLAFVELILGLVMLCKGRLKHCKAPYVLGWFIFILTAIMFAEAYRNAYFCNKFIATIANKFDVEYAGLTAFFNYDMLIVGIAFVLLLVIGIVYAACLKKTVFYEDVIWDNENVSHSLPKGITDIPNKAYTKDVNLEIAIIPEGIPSLGDSAFANCIKLKVVDIPTSVTKIGFNCFFNCYELKKITYKGSKEEWSKISFGSNWLTKSGTNKVTCYDGEVTIDTTEQVSKII